MIMSASNASTTSLNSLSTSSNNSNIRQQTTSSSNLTAITNVSNPLPPTTTTTTTTTSITANTNVSNNLINPTSNDSNSNDSLSSSLSITVATTTTVASTTNNNPMPSSSSSTSSTSSSSSSSSNTTGNDSRWIFSQEKIQNSPSRADGITLEEELSQRQESALFIQDLGGILKVNQLCINTAIIYMHRFYMIHSLKKFHHYVRMVATACLFFACKVEEQPRRLREVIDSIQKVFHKSNEPISQNSEEHRKYGDEIVALESCLLQTLGFNVLVNHAHTVIIKTCQMIKAPRDLAEAAYLTATNSLILTNFCVKFSSEKVACFCIYLACKWTSLIIPTSSEGLQWYQYVKHDIVEQELEDISKEYLTIYDQCPPKVQKKLGKSKTLDESANYDARTNQPSSQKHPQQQLHQGSHIVKKPTHPHINPQHQDMHTLHKQQSSTNVNINEAQQQTSHPNLVKQQPHPHQQQSQLPNMNKQPPIGAQLQNGAHPNSKATHYYQNQQYQQQHHQNRPSGQHHPQLTGPPHSQNKLLMGTTNGTPKQQNQQPNTVKNSFNSPNLNKTNGISTNNFNSSNNNNLNQTGSTTSFQNNNSTIESGYPNNNINNINKNSFHLNNNPKKLHTNNNTNTNLNQSTFKSSPSTSANNLNTASNQSNNTNNTSMKRGNEELNILTSAPNKIPKYVIDQKSAS